MKNGYGLVRVMNIKAKIGVTGCNGFVGKQLVTHLNGEKIDYVCFKGDLLNKKDVKDFFDKNTITTVIHLVGVFNPPFDNLISKNVYTTQNLLEIGCRKSLKKIIYSSTGAVYGKPLNSESFEDDILLPNTLYGLSKMYAEECIKYYAGTKQLEYVLLRFSSIYGDGNTKGVIYNFLSAIQRGEDVIIEGDGEQSRNFLHIEDACQAILSSINYDSSTILNISNPEKITINNIIHILEKKYNFNKNYRKSNNNLRNLLLNTDKSKKVLGFQPKHKIAEYLLNK